jgi:hypothetical protein
MCRPRSERGSAGLGVGADRNSSVAGMRELLSQLDGTRASRVALLAGMTREELDSVGGIEEDE